MTAHELRESPEGVLAIHDIRLYGGVARPWSVLWIPPHHRAHWPSMPLHDQDVALWAVMRADYLPADWQRQIYNRVWPHDEGTATDVIDLIKTWMPQPGEVPA